MEVYYTRGVSERRSLCIGALTRDQAFEAGAVDDLGYFLYERELVDGDEEIEILARVDTVEAAERIARLMIYSA